MEKSGISIKIPGHCELVLRHMVSDYTGTLSYRGVLTAGVYQKLHQLGEALDVHVLSADTRGTAKEQLRDLPLRLHILTGTDHDVQKRDFAKHFSICDRSSHSGTVRTIGYC